MKLDSAARIRVVELFRSRLREVITTSGQTRSAFAEQVGMDRSTLSQLLSSDHDRLPRAETIAAIAATASVSVDWLLGLSQQGQVGTDVLRERTPEIETGAGSPTDERLMRWHTEAVGYKIRYVPSTLPDLLKTPAVIRYEYGRRSLPVAAGRMELALERLAYSRRPETDMEVCSSRQSLEDFAAGAGIWRGLPVEHRREQLQTMCLLSDELYPTFRWFLFDGLEQYCVPLTVFGPLRAALYVGDMYVVFNATEQVRALTQHFDALVRAAVVQPVDVPAVLDGLLGSLE